MPALLRAQCRHARHQTQSRRLSRGRLQVAARRFGRSNDLAVALAEQILGRAITHCGLHDVRAASDAGEGRKFASTFVDDWNYRHRQQAGHEGLLQALSTTRRVRTRFSVFAKSARFSVRARVVGVLVGTSRNMNASPSRSISQWGKVRAIQVFPRKIDQGAIEIESQPETATWRSCH
jgi:hypothetical protein